jgi:hypothetical protein
MSESDQQGTGEGASGEKPKRVVKRKPLWLAVPKEYSDIVNEAGEIEHSPISYELYECENKTQVQKVLAKLGLDAKTLNPADVKIFRGDPLPLKLDMQVTIRF